MEKPANTSARYRPRTLARAVLHGGPWFKPWLRWKSAKQTAQYQKVLLSAGESKPTRDGGKTSSPVLPADRLRKLLFVCDNMWEQRELLPELNKICEVTFLDVHANIQTGGEGGVEKLSHDAVQAKLKESAKVEFDAVIVYLRSTLLTPELVGVIRQTWRCPVIGLNLDCKTTFANYNVFRGAPVNYRAQARLFDCNLTNARAMLDVYASEGFPVLYLPTGYHYDPAIHKVRPDDKFDIPISFVGSCKPERAALIERLREIGIDVKVFGSGWDGAPFVRDAWQFYQRSQLNLGMGYNVPDARFTNLKNRDFECPGSGGCYLTTYDWELAGLFDIGKEILCYRSTDDLVELYSYYSRRPAECLRIATAGFHRCVREHTWEQRFRKVFGELGFRLGA